jgi:hypothetical protein
MEFGTECSETSAYKIQTPGNYPEESIKHSERGEVWNQEDCLFDLHRFMQKNPQGWSQEIGVVIRLPRCKGGLL